jgi:hypothetical protein
MTVTNQEIIDLLGKDTLLWSPSLEKHVAPIEILANKVVSMKEGREANRYSLTQISHSSLGLVLLLGALVWTYVESKRIIAKDALI